MAAPVLQSQIHAYDSSTSSRSGCSTCQCTAHRLASQKSILEYCDKTIAVHCTVCTERTNPLCQNSQCQSAGRPGLGSVASTHTIVRAIHPRANLPQPDNCTHQSCTKSMTQCRASLPQTLLAVKVLQQKLLRIASFIDLIGGPWAWGGCLCPCPCHACCACL